MVHLFQWMHTVVASNFVECFCFPIKVREFEISNFGIMIEIIDISITNRDRLRGV